MSWTSRPVMRDIHPMYRRILAEKLCRCAPEGPANIRSEQALLEAVVDIAADRVRLDLGVAVPGVQASGLDEIAAGVQPHDLRTQPARDMLGRPQQLAAATLTTR